jgi:hypothetical protein
MVAIRKPRTERHVDRLSVGDNGDAAIKERVQHKLAVHALVAAGGGKCTRDKD